MLAQKEDKTIVPPRTKKNSPQLIPHMKHPIMVPSEAYREWERAARGTMVRLGVCHKSKDEDGKPCVAWSLGTAIDYPVNCQALIYRDRLVGDAVGFYQALGDFLELVGIVKNDKWIVQWDGTRLMKDAKFPRIEVVLTQIGAGATPEPLALFATAPGDAE